MEEDASAEENRATWGQGDAPPRPEAQAQPGEFSQRNFFAEHVTRVFVSRVLAAAYDFGGLSLSDVLASLGADVLTPKIPASITHLMIYI
jgi:hypothetical protein